LPVLHWNESKATDRSLSAFLITVEQVDGDHASLGNRAGYFSEDRFCRIAQRPLPESVIARRPP
jgi:hypothetical protein